MIARPGGRDGLLALHFDVDWIWFLESAISSAASAFVKPSGFATNAAGFVRVSFSSHAAAPPAFHDAVSHLFHHEPAPLHGLRARLGSTLGDDDDAQDGSGSLLTSQHYQDRWV